MKCRRETGGAVHCGSAPWHPAVARSSPGLWALRASTPCAARECSRGAEWLDVHPVVPLPAFPEFTFGGEPAVGSLHGPFVFRAEALAETAASRHERVTAAAMAGTNMGEAPYGEVGPRPSSLLSDTYHFCAEWCVGRHRDVGDETRRRQGTRTASTTTSSPGRGSASRLLIRWTSWGSGSSPWRASRATSCAMAVSMSWPGRSMRPSV